VHLSVTSRKLKVNRPEFRTRFNYNSRIAEADAQLHYQVWPSALLFLRRIKIGSHHPAESDRPTNGLSIWVCCCYFLWCIDLSWGDRDLSDFVEAFYMIAVRSNIVVTRVHVTPNRSPWTHVILFCIQSQRLRCTLRSKHGASSKWFIELLHALSSSFLSSVNFLIYVWLIIRII
jgi:hypothetical protein